MRDEAPLSTVVEVGYVKNICTLCIYGAVTTTDSRPTCSHLNNNKRHNISELIMKLAQSKIQRDALKTDAILM
jgi:hypothetical protein